MVYLYQSVKQDAGIKVKIEIRLWKDSKTNLIYARQTDKSVLTRLLMLIKNKYALWGLPRPLLTITHIFLDKLKRPFCSFLKYRV